MSAFLLSPRAGRGPRAGGREASDAQPSEREGEGRLRTSLFRIRPLTRSASQTRPLPARGERRSRERLQGGAAGVARLLPELLLDAEELGDTAQYAGRDVLRRALARS